MEAFLAPFFFLVDGGVDLRLSSPFAFNSFYFVVLGFGKQNRNEKVGVVQEKCDQITIKRKTQIPIDRNREAIRQKEKNQTVRSFGYGLIDIRQQ